MRIFKILAALGILTVFIGLNCRIFWNPTVDYADKLLVLIISTIGLNHAIIDYFFKK